jgi:hypothetical protein
MLLYAGLHNCNQSMSGLIAGETLSTDVIWYITAAGSPQAPMSPKAAMAAAATAAQLPAAASNTQRQQQQQRQEPSWSYQQKQQQ